MIKLKKAKAKHLEILSEMYAQLIEDEGHHGKVPLTKLKAKMNSWLHSNAHEVVLFFDGPVPLGYALWEWFTSSFDSRKREVFLRQFFVARSQRRHGVGSQAFQTLKEQYWKAAKSIELETYSWNERAASFWRHLGFEDYLIGYRLDLHKDHS